MHNGLVFCGMNDNMHLRGNTVDHITLPFNNNVLKLTILNTVVWFIKFFLFLSVFVYLYSNIEYYFCSIDGFELNCVQKTKKGESYVEIRRI